MFSLCSIFIVATISVFIIWLLINSDTKTQTHRQKMGARISYWIISYFILGMTFLLMYIALEGQEQKIIEDKLLETHSYIVCDDRIIDLSEFKHYIIVYDNKVVFMQR